MLSSSCTRWQVFLFVGLGLVDAGCLGGATSSILTAPSYDSGLAPTATAGEGPVSAGSEPSEVPSAPPASAAAGASPGPAGLPAVSCATAQLAVCDDFEVEAVGAAPSTKLWRVGTNNKQQSITVDDTRALRGKQSLHVHTTNQGFERAEIVNTSMFPAPSNNFFGRVFFYLDSEVPQIHCNIVRAGGLRPGETQQTSYNIGTQFQLMIDGYYDATSPGKIIDEAKHAATQEGGVWKNATYMPSRRWACLEWQFDGAGNNLHVWLDGTAITLLDSIAGAPALSTEHPWIAPTFSEVGLGWTVIANSEKFDHFDLWLDAVALDGSRIGCDR